MFYGLIAAFGWGMSAVAATKAARRTGTYLALLCGQGLGVVVLLLLAELIRPSLGAVSGPTVLVLAGAGLLGLAGYLTFYRALEVSGAAGLVSAVSATYGGVTTVLAVLVLREHMNWAGDLGVFLAVAGTVIAATRPGSAQTEPGTGARAIAVRERALARIRALSRSGVPLAIASALTYGMSGFLLGSYSPQAGALVAALVVHGASVTALLLALPLVGRRVVGRGGPSGMAWAAAAGLTDIVGLLGFATGGQVGQVAITAAVSSVYPVIPLVAGTVFFGEELTVRQVTGIAAIIAGLLLIGLSS